jgi:hypothetical protein
MLALMLVLGTATAAELPLTLVDLPHHAQGPGFGMPASLELGYSTHRLSLLGAQAVGDWLLPERPLVRNAAGLAVATGLAQLGITTWVHEEWHRAPMSQYGIANQNTYHDPSAWKQAAAGVHLVADEDLAWLKAEHPADLVRAHTAGMEAEHALVRRVGQELIREADRPLLGPLRSAGSWMTPALITAELSNLTYLQYCGPDSDEPPSDEYEPREAYRDFTGWDGDAWAYDLILPDEPYAERGTHPSGSGIDRYRVWSDLPPEAQQVLTRYTQLYWLNLVNPDLLGINAFAVGPYRVNGALDVMWTPYGYSVGTRGRLLAGEVLYSAELGVGINRELRLPAVTIGAEGIPLGERVGLDLELSGWLQPEQLRWDDTTASPGGRVGLGLRYAATPWLALRAEGMAKTQGWVLGEVSLEPAVAGRLGVDFTL